jgi:hypothetical protein
MGILGILVALGLLIWLAYLGWSILLLAPAAAVLAAGLAGEPLLAHWTQTFMGSAARFIMQFFPIFVLGALFGKLMEDSDDFIRQIEPRVEVATKEAVTRAATLVQTGDRATVLAVLGAAMAFGWLLVKTANSSVVSNR